MRHEDRPQRESTTPGAASSPDSVSRRAECGPVSAGRRQFLKKAAIASAPVLLTVASRPALGDPCSVSGMMSGNLSAPNPVVCLGLSVGYWSQHPEIWPAGYNPAVPSASNDDGHDYGRHGALQAYVGSGTLFHDVFDPIYAAYDGLTLMEVLRLQGKADPYQLGAQTVAALLNAAYFPLEAFGYTEGQIIDLYNTNAASDPVGLKQLFETLNLRS